jgi:sugar phosphate isomerase/epimerase
VKDQPGLLLDVRFDQKGDPDRVSYLVEIKDRNATHIKDVMAHRGDPRSFAFWPSVPLGRGLIDLPAILALLAQHGYDGQLALEIDYLAPAYAPAGEDAAVADSVAWLQAQVRAMDPGQTGAGA